MGRGIMASKTAFLALFGDSPVLRVLDFLVVNDDFDYSMTDIAKFSGVGYSTLKLFWSRLERERIIHQVRTVGKAKLYKLNMANTQVRKFRKFYWSISKNAVRKELVKQPKRRVVLRV